MADYERYPPRGGGGGRGGYQNRKRRFRDDREDDYDRRPQRRRYEEPLADRIRKQLWSIAESPLKRVEDDISQIAKVVCENYEDGELRANFFDATLQLVVEQPFKIPFAAAVIMVMNTLKSEVVRELLEKAAQKTEAAVERGEWRQVKLYLKFLGSLQGLLEGEGVFAVLQDLLGKAMDLQTENNEETIGPELAKIILLTIPYVMASSATDAHDKAIKQLEDTSLITSEPHPLEQLVNPYPGNGKDEIAEPTGMLVLLQKQLEHESTHGWELFCLPRTTKMIDSESLEALASAPKHSLPTIALPEVLNAGPRPLFPELYFSVYANQDVETVPPVTDISSILLRDALVDTINILDYNRNATAKFLIDIDCYFAPDTFVKRATPFDRLRDVEGDRSTWKPEDVAVDAVFSQLFQLPTPEHKLVYYHSVLTEACKIAPAAIAPSLGRAIRFLYRNVDSMDLELSYRFMDWFSHHLSNFGFTWKWTEWIDDVELPDLDPKKAFIIGALDKEIRLSFAQRIKGTLPQQYQALIGEEKEKDTPDFKYNDDSIPFSKEGKDILNMLRQKTPEDQIQAVIDRIHSQASEMALPDPLVSSTDAYVTSICYIGSKSLSHVLSCIERCKERLLAIGPASSVARRQIITSVMEYWKDQPGIGVNIVDKLLNYTILSPASVIEWALSKDGDKLGRAYVYEMVNATVGKVTGRARQVHLSKMAPGLLDEQRAMLSDAADRERAGMKELFGLMEDLLQSWASGSKDETMQTGNGDTEEEDLVRRWGERWARVFRRKWAVEEAWGTEVERIGILPDEPVVGNVSAGAAAAEGDGMAIDGANGNTVGELGLVA